MMPAATLLKIINTRVAKVQPTWDENFIVKLKKFSSRVDPPLVPQTQIQQRPQMKSPILRLRPMLLEHPADEPVIQQIPAPHRRVHQVLVEPATQSLPKPLTHRRAKPALALVQQIARQDLFKRAFENVFAARALDFQRTRQP